MPSFSRLIHFQTADSAEIYFADLGKDKTELPQHGSKIEAYRSFDELTKGTNPATASVGKVQLSQPSICSLH